MAAYRALEWSGKMSEQQRAVVDHMLKTPAVSWTRQELSKALGWGINVVCGRVNELATWKPLQILVELPEKRDCTVTKSRVTALVLARAEANEGGGTP